MENDYRAAPLFFQPIPVNRTDRKTLTTVPGIGAVLAARIIDYRNRHGHYKSVLELRNVEGVGRKKLEILNRYVSI